MYVDMDQPIHASFFGRVTQKKGFWHSGRKIRNHILVYLIHGDLKFQIGEKEYSGHTGDFFFIPAQTFYAPLQSSGCTYYVIHFTAAQTEKAEQTVRVVPTEGLQEDNYAYDILSPQIVSEVCLQSHMTCAEQEAIQNVFSRIVKLRIWDSPTDKLMLDHLVREILLLLNCDLYRTKYTDRRVHDMVQFVHDHYAEPIKLHMLARFASVSESYAARLFRQYLHMSSAEYINRVRLQAACDLLVNSSLSIGPIAELVGFSSLYYFSRVFRQQYGMAPSKFRNGVIAV